MVRVAVQDGRKLLAGDRIIRAELRIAVPGNEVIHARPVDRRAVIGVCIYVCIGVSPVAFGHIR